MNYKLDNPVAFKVIECLMLDRPIATKKVVEHASSFDNNIRQSLYFCLDHKMIHYLDAYYIYIMYSQTFKKIIKNRNKELRMRNVTR